MLWDRELKALEAEIASLNVAYDSFLYGTTAKPPIEARKKLDQVLRRLSSEEPDSAADRYRFATLQTRYAALCDRWEKLQAEKESGKRPGIHGGFVRESRRVAAAASSPRAQAAPNAAAAPSVVKGGDVGLFERYLAARKSRGEEVNGYDLGRFQESLAREREKLRERLGDADVEFDVAERDGRVKLVARRKTGAAPGAEGSERKK